MTPYAVYLKNSAQRELDRLPPASHEAVLKQLKALRFEARPRNAAKLQGRPEYKIRVGNLRIIYGVDDAKREVMVYMIDDRKQVYRRLR